MPILGTQSDIIILPGASLEGLEKDVGVDTDGDGTFDDLILGVKINVLVAGYYEVQVKGLWDNNTNSLISVSGYKISYLGAGLRVLNVSLNGPDIYVSGRNATHVSYMELWGGSYPYERNFYGSLSQVALSKKYLYTQFDPPNAMLTGNIDDWGNDTDGDGTYNYLVISVEIDVTSPGAYSVYVSGLRDAYWNWIDVWEFSESVYFGVGLGWLNVSLSGYTIRAWRRNATYVNYISLSADYPSYLHDQPLSKTYLYTEFDAPAVLTRKVIDRGIDTDNDHAFNLLEIGVEVNVSDPGNYWISVSGLLDSYFSFIDVYASKEVSLAAGLQFVNFTLDGTKIHLSRRNPRYINQISLTFQEKEDWYRRYWQDESRVPLSKEYYYTQFDPPGIMLTGKISDRGVDTDTNQKFDFLEVGVEVNVTEAGTYVVYVSGLRGDDPYYWGVWVWDSKTISLDRGVHTVYLSLYGPEIYASRLNVTRVNYISVRDKQYRYSDYRNDIPLSKKYSWKDFDAPFTDVETKFVVYPDGRVAIEGSLKHTDMVPKNRGPTAQGFFNLTGDAGTTQALAGLTLTFPEEMASEFPLNSTTANLLATYSNGLLNLGINSTMTLPPGDNRYQPYGQWPFNTTDGAIRMTYSGGILNINIEGDTILPPVVSKQFPFNTTDISVVGTYSPNTLDGTITFSVLDAFTFDDVNVDFTGTPTDLTLNGTIHVVFNVPLGGDDFIIHDETELKQMIDEIKSVLPGEKGLVWNMTGGLLNVTALDIDYVLTDEGALLPGATVTFKINVHGDFFQALTYIMSGGRNQMLPYPLLNEAYQSVKGASFDIRYSHTTSKASIKLTFSYDLKRLIDYILTPPTGTTPYVMTSYDMQPTIYLGDVVFVQAVSNAGDIIANSTGDIIAFRKPSDPRYIIIHRAINKTQVDGTWYFQTQGDANYSPDYWTGNGTYNGMVSENYLLGRVTSRIPFLGHLLAYPYPLYYYEYYFPFPQSTVAPRLALLKALFSSLESLSMQLSYSSAEKRFDFKFVLVVKLKALIDEVAQILPETLPPETPPELKSFVESLLKTKYASVSSAQASLSYENGKADFKATATIEGDLNAQINYAKDLYLHLMRAPYSRYNMTIPWQQAFINQTQIDISNLKVSAQLGETSFEGRIQGITVMPPLDSANATDFQLKRFFNLTASPYEFPGVNQRLKITIEGGNNATHIVTLYSPPTVPQPDFAASYGRYMVWNNQTLSSLKDLVFKTVVAGTLTVKTTPVRGEVFVDGESWGLANQSRVVPVGVYNVRFGDVEGYRTPASRQATVYENVETTIIGVYAPITGRLTITTTPVSGEVFVNGTSWGVAPQSRDVLVGTYNASFGRVDRFYTPAWRLVTVSESIETTTEGAYTPITGTLTITTTPVAGEVFVDGVSWGMAPQSRVVQIGTYNVTFGAKEGYTTPANKIVTVNENAETSVEGIYEAQPTTPLWAWIIVVVVAAVVIITAAAYYRRRKQRPEPQTLAAVKPTQA